MGVFGWEVCEGVVGCECLGGRRVVVGWVVWIWVGGVCLWRGVAELGGGEVCSWVG